MTSDALEKAQETKTMSVLRLLLKSRKQLLRLLAVFVLLVVSGYAIAADSIEDATSASFANVGRTSAGIKKTSRLQEDLVYHSDNAPGSAPVSAPSSPLAASSASSFSTGAQFLHDYDSSLREMDEIRQSEITERLLVHQGDMTLETDLGKLDSLVTQIEDLVKSEANGYVQSRSTYLSHYSQRRTTNLELRVASQNFSAIVDSIQRLVPPKMVISVSISSRDVTEEYVDVSTRADVLDASRASLKNLMLSAKGVREIMEIHRELNRLTEEYEKSRRRANTLRKESSLSFLSLVIREREYNAEKPKPWFNPTEKMRLALIHMAKMLGFITETVAYASVWLVPLTILYIALSIAYNRSSRTAGG